MRYFLYKSYYLNIFITIAMMTLTLPRWGRNCYSTVSSALSSALKNPTALWRNAGCVDREEVVDGR